MTSTSAAPVREQARIGFLWLISTTAVWQVISWALTLITARLILPTDYGILSLSETLTPYFMMVATLRVETWLVQRTNITEQVERSALALLLALGIVCTAVAYLIAPFIGSWYGEPRMILPFQALSVLFLLRALTVVPESRLRRRLDFKSLSLANVTIGTTRGLLQLPLAYYGYGYWALVFGALFKEIATLIWLVLVAGTPRRFAWSSVAISDAFNYGVTATIASVFWIIFSTADNLIVGKYFGADVLGLYAMAFFLADLPLSKINTTLSPLLVPLFSKLKESKEELVKLYVQLNRWTITILGPILLGMLAVREEIVNLLLGERWAGLSEPLGIMCVVGLYRATSGNAATLFYSVGLPKIVLKWTALICAVLVPSFVVLGTSSGIWGIYLSWLLIYPLVGLIPITVIVARELKVSIKELVWPLIPAFVSSILMLAVVHVSSGLCPEGVTRLISMILLGAIVYSLSFLILFTRETKRLIAEFRGLTSGSPR